MIQRESRITCRQWKINFSSMYMIRVPHTYVRIARIVNRNMTERRLWRFLEIDRRYWMADIRRWIDMLHLMRYEIIFTDRWLGIELQRGRYNNVWRLTRLWNSNEFPFIYRIHRDHLTLTEMIGSESICMIKRLVTQRYSRDRGGVTIEPELTL